MIKEHMLEIVAVIVGLIALIFHLKPKKTAVPINNTATKEEEDELADDVFYCDEEEGE